MMKKLERSSFGFICIIGILTAIVILAPFPHKVLSWDIFGYYLYLPLTFIYNDLGIKNIQVIHQIIDTYQNTSTFYQAMPALDGQWVLKYPMGMAVLYSPFFIIGHIWAILSAYPDDGFSYPYQASLLYGSFVYTTIGLIYLKRSLDIFFRASLSLLVIFILVFGTNFLVHTVYHGQGLMSHNYLFMLFALVFWYTLKWHSNPSMKTAFWLALFIGLGALSRPTEFLVILVPLFWNVSIKNGFMDKVELLRREWKSVLTAAITLFFIGSVQLVYYKTFTGHYFFNSYSNNPGEGFEFFSPYIWEVLFSFRKGWLIYTPIMMLAIMGFVFMYIKNQAAFISVLIFFFLSFYIISSWSCWWYADSFSQRSFIPMYVFLSLPLGHLLQIIFERAKTWLRMILWMFIILLVLLNLFQSWQFLHGIIHTSRMTQEYYKEVFLQTKVPAGAENMLLIDRNLSPEEILKSGRKFESRILHVNDFESDGQVADTNRMKEISGNVFEINKNNQFSPVFETTYDKLNLAEFGIIKVSVQVFPVVKMSENPFYFTATFMYSGKAYAYKGIQLTDNNLLLNAWNQLEFYYLTPEVRNNSDNFRTTFWLQGQHPVYIDDLKVEVFFEN